MTAPCDIEPKLVSTQDGPFFRMDYFASSEGCMFFENSGDWTSASVAEMRITNTSKAPIKIYTTSAGSLRPKSIVEVKFPDRVSNWRGGPPTGKKWEQLEVPVAPGMVWKSNQARILSPSAALAVKNARPMGRGFLPVNATRPRTFVVNTRFIATVQQGAARHEIKINLNSRLDISYFPDQEEDDPIDK